MMVHFGSSFILRNEQLHGFLDGECLKNARRTRSPDSRKSVARIESKVISRNIRAHSKKLYLV